MNSTIGLNPIIAAPILNPEKPPSLIGVSIIRFPPNSISEIGRPYPGNQFGLDFAIVEDPNAFQGASKGTFWWWGIAGSWFWIDPQEEIVLIGMIQNNDIGLSLQIQRAARAAIYQ